MRTDDVGVEKTEHEENPAGLAGHVLWARTGKKWGNKNKQTELLLQISDKYRNKSSYLK